MAQNEAVAVEGMPFDPFVGQVFTAMISQGHAISNAIEDNLREQIKELQTAYINLWENVYESNQKVDSARLERVLDKHHYKYETALRQRGEDGS